MITPILVAILGGLLVLVLVQLMKKPKQQPAQPAYTPPAQDLANLKVTDARPGDMISVSGAGDDMADLDFTAEHYTQVQAGARNWFELSGSYRGRRVQLRVASDEDVETGLHSAPTKVTLEDLGLSEDDLAQMDERQNQADNFEFEGKPWNYSISREARAWRDGQPPIGYYYWEFREEGGRRLCAVRKAEGEPFTVTIYNLIPAQDITIYRGARA